MELHKDVEHPIWVDRSFDEVMWRRVDSDDVHTWFERCLEDFPDFPDTAHTMYAVYWYGHVQTWRKKWFGQFDSSTSTKIGETNDK